MIPAIQPREGAPLLNTTPLPEKEVHTRTKNCFLRAMDWLWQNRFALEIIAGLSLGVVTILTGELILLIPATLLILGGCFDYAIDTRKQNLIKEAAGKLKQEEEHLRTLEALYIQFQTHMPTEKPPLYPIYGVDRYIEAVSSAFKPLLVEAEKHSDGSVSKGFQNIEQGTREFQAQLKKRANCDALVCNYHKHALSSARIAERYAQAILKEAEEQVQNRKEILAGFSK